MRKSITPILVLSLILSVIPVNASKNINCDIFLPAEYHDINIYEEHSIFTASDKNNKYAIYDFNGNKCSDNFESISPFTGTYTIAKSGNMEYIINLQGEILSSYENRNIISLSDKYVFIDASENNDGRPLKYYEGECNAYTVDGEFVRSLPYEQFVENNISHPFQFSGLRMIIYKDGKYGAASVSNIDTCIQPTYESLSIFSEEYNTAIAKLDGKYGLIYLDGSTRADFIYDNITPVSGNPNGYAYVTEKDGLFGLIHHSGKTLYEPVLKYPPTNVYQEYCLIEIQVDNTREDKDEYPYLYGLTDYMGNVTLPLEHTDIISLSEGKIAAAKSYDHAGYYDLYGNEVTEFKYRMCSPFSEGHAIVSRPVNENEWEHHVIDTHGNILFKIENHAYGFFSGMAYLENHKLIDTKGNLLEDFSEKDIKLIPTEWMDKKGTNIFRISDGKNYGLARITHNPLHEPEWDYEYIDLRKTENSDEYTLPDESKIFIDSYGNIFYSQEELNNFHHYNNRIKSDKNNASYKFDEYTVLINGDNTKILDDKSNILSQFTEFEIKEYGGDGYFIVYLHNDHNICGAIDKHGNFIVPLGEYYVEYIDYGVFRIYKQPYDDCAFINSEGKIIAAYSTLSWYVDKNDNGYIGISTDGFEGFINSEGKVMLSLPYGYSIAGAFSEGIAPIEKAATDSFEGEILYINEQGNIMLSSADEAWTECGSMKNGLFSVKVGKVRFEKDGTRLLAKCLYDTPSDWAKSDVESAIEKKFLPDELQKRYKKNITREVFCEIAYNIPLIQNALADSALTKEIISFTDTDNEKIIALSSLGIIQGVGNNKFAPTSFITREEAATILDRICNYIRFGSTTPGYVEFSDDDAISDWAKASVYNIRNAGIMLGVGDNKFAPKDNYTTEQSVATIMRINSMIEK